MHAYLRALVGMLASALAAVAALNAVVDPFGVLPAPRLEGVNVPKTETEDLARLWKAHAVRWIEPTAVILGSSSALIGFDPEHAAWQRERSYNLALPGGNIVDCRRHLEHALVAGPLREVVLPLDLSMFNVHFQVAGDFDERRLLVGPGGERAWGRPLEPVALLVSGQTLRASLRTLYRNAVAAPGTIAWPDGRLDVRREAEWVERNGGVRRAFEELEKGFLWKFYFPPPARAFELEDPRTGRSSFVELERILRLADENEITIRLLFSPTHARLREVTLAAGLGQELERWTRRVVEMAAAYDVPLYDFGGYNRFTTEELPPPGGGTMRWYFDPAHYKKELGDLVLDRILSNAEAPEPAFGVRLSPEILDAHFEASRLAREAYRDAHPADVAEIRGWAERAEASRAAARRRESQGG